MSRGLTDAPEPESSGPTNQELDGAVRELYHLVNTLFDKVDQLEDIIAKALRLEQPEEEAEKPKRVRGL
jgi:hypothetical protein